MASKEKRTELHKAVRELFKGKLDSETDMTAPAGGAEEGSKIAIKWSRRGGRGGARGGGRGMARVFYNITVLTFPRWRP